MLLETDTADDSPRIDVMLLRRERRPLLTLAERTAMTDVVNSIAMWVWGSISRTAPVKEGSVS